VDSSTKVGEKNFMKVKTFIKQTVGTFNIGLNQTHVGLILFNTKATLVFALDEYDTSQDIQHAVDNIAYTPANKTNTGISNHLLKCYYRSDSGCNIIKMKFS
jgi:hypothetical protein